MPGSECLVEPAQALSARCAFEELVGRDPLNGCDQDTCNDGHGAAGNKPFTSFKIFLNKDLVCR